MKLEPPPIQEEEVDYDHDEEMEMEVEARPALEVEARPALLPEVPGLIPLLSAPDTPVQVPEDIANKPPDLKEDVANLIGDMANVDRSHRSLGEVVGAIDSVPRNQKSTPRDPGHNLGGTEQFKSFERNAEGEFVVLPQFARTRSSCIVNHCVMSYYDYYDNDKTLTIAYFLAVGFRLGFRFV